MNTANTKRYEIIKLNGYGPKLWVVRCIETGTETVPMRQAAAARVARALRGAPALHAAEEAAIDCALVRVFCALEMAVAS
jgi:hypothetical protein